MPKGKNSELTASVWKAFDHFYAPKFENYQQLKQALLLPKRHVARINGFISVDEKQKLKFDVFGGNSSDGDNVVNFGGKFEVFEVDMDEDAFSKAPPQKTANSGIRPYYVMDLASICPVLCLNVQPGDRVLDMCAAPGGKTLLLAEGIKSSGFLIANEMSSSRKGRLVQVINDYIPEPIKQRVAVTGYDGSKWHFAEQKIYDKILLDAPCSGERHLVGNPKEFVNWSEKRTKNMAQRQMQLLYAAAMALKVGGRIMYSTCSISPYENDQVVQKTVTKHKNAKLQVVPISDLYGDVLPIGKATELGGWQILPDEDDNWGPIYFCLIERVE